MIESKHLSKIIISLMAIAVVLCLLAVTFGDKLQTALGGKGVSMEYETKLFDTSEIISIDIQMDDDQWEELLSNPLSEEFYKCDVVINGETIKNVGIRTKGNTSLSSIAMDPDTDRYSFKLEFDHYVENQTCFGLDKLILNNNYADATNMKEAIIYDMFQYLGADASLYNYAQININGEYWGVYLALEAVEDSFKLRNYGTEDGELYKPESMGMGGGDDSDNKPSGDFPGGGNPPTGDFDSDNMPDFGGGDFDPDNMPDFEGGDFDPSKMGGGPANGGGGPSMGDNGGSDLNYVDDDLDSYETIWDGAVSDTSKSDRRRVVTALKNISEGTDLEDYMDIDNILKYMAVHEFAVNLDSLSGNMAHNYYLYENDGKLNMIPWDYNLSFGGMSMNKTSADEMINDAIDSPFSGTNFFDKLLENEEYKEQYHEYLRMLCEEYVNGGKLDETYQRIRSQIDELVATDPTAFYNEEEYEAAADMLYDTVKLRAQSVLGQLGGDIPSTDEGQRQDSSALIDASQINIEAMGQFDMGGKQDGMETRRQDNQGGQ